MDTLARGPGGAAPARRLDLLSLAASSVLASLRLDEVLPRVLRLAAGALSADAYAVWRVGEDGSWRILARAGLSDRYATEATRRLAGSPAPREPLVLEDPDAAPELRSHRALQRDEGVESLLVAPLLLDGRPQGTLAFYYRSRRRFEPDDVDAATLAANLASAALRNAELYEASLREAERFRFLADHAHDVVARISPEGVFLDASPASVRVLGYAPEELVGRRVAELVHPEDLARVDASASSQPRLHVARYRHRDGRWVQLEVALKPMGDPEARVTELVASLRDVTQREAQERALHLHRRVLDSMAEGVNLVDERGVIVYTNPAEDAMFGYAPGELIGKSVEVLNAAPPEENARMVAEILRTLDARGSWEGEFDNVRKDGTRFATRARITRIELDGRPHSISVQQDVTQERELRERERRRSQTLRTLHRVQTDLASKLDLEEVVQASTDAATRLTGAEFGAFFYNVTDPDGACYMLYTLSGVPREAFAQFPMPRATKLFGPTFAGEGVVRVDDVRADPRYGQNPPHHGMPQGHLPVRSYLAVPVVGRAGVVHGGLFFGHSEVGRFDEVSEEIAVGIAAQTAIALDNAHLYRRAKENEARLQESEHRFRTLVNATTQMVWSANADGFVDDLPEWRAFTGQTAEEVRGMGWLDAVHPEDRARVVETWNRAYTARAVYLAEYRVRGKDGAYRHFEARAVPRFGPQGELLEYIGTWTDVTERKRIMSEAEALRAQLIQGERLAALGQLVSGVAHELRTPLTFLNNNAFLARQTIERAARKGASAQEIVDAAAPYLDEITAGVDRINALVSDLRRYTKARTDAGLVRTSLDVVALDAVELFRAANRGAHVVRTSLAPTRPVLANVGTLQQLLLNLLQNAADVAPRDRPIFVATRDALEGVVLEVTDEGPGIPPEVQARMYEPLFTTKPEGTGLGLSIVKRIVDEHRGRIACDTAPGKGTTFRVTLPVA